MSRKSQLLNENLSYKLVALFIALILWLTVLGRRDIVMSKSLDVEIASRNDQIVMAQSSDEVRIRVQGPRASLRKFIEQAGYPMVVLDVSSLPEGVQVVDIPVEKIEVPFGVKIVSIRPKSIRVEIRKR